MTKRKLNETKNDDEALNNVLDTAYRLLENPIALFDTSYNLLWNAPAVVTDDPLWNELIALQKFSPESVYFFNTEGFIGAYAMSETVSFMKSDKLKYDRMNGKIFDKDNVQIGNVILIAASRPFKEGDAELLETICGKISDRLYACEMYKKIDRVYQKTVIGDLIEGTVKPERADTKELEKLYEGLEPNLYIGVADVTEFDRSITHLAYFRDVFKQIMPEYKYFAHSNYVVMILGVNGLLSVKKHLSGFVDFFAKYKIYAGISSAFSDLTQIRKYYQEALNALNYGQKSGRHDNIFIYDNYRLERSLKAQNKTPDFLYPLAATIKDYDNRNGTSYAKVLCTYLMYGMDAAKSASELNISQSALSQDLETMGYLFDIDYQNGDMLTGIYITFKMQNEQ